jgi:adenosine deaminase
LNAVLNASSPLSLDDFCRLIPKAELHCHLLGAIRRETFLELARRENAIEPAEIDALYAGGENRKGVIPALRALEARVLRYPDDFYRLTVEYLEDARAHNILYTEFFWNPTGCVKGSGLSYVSMQEAIIQAISDAEKSLGIVGRLIPAIDRETTAQAAVEMVEWLAGCRRMEVPGIGMDFREVLGPPEQFEAAYAYAKRLGLKATAHAGEYGMPWTNVRTAIDVLGVDRVDHGYTTVDDASFARRCADSGIVFTVVPANSYYFRTLPPDRWALDHPIRKMHAMGLRLHPNSDDPSFFKISPTKAWRMMVEDFEIDPRDLRAMMLNGLDGAWMEDTTRQAWRASWTATFDALFSRLQDSDKVE